MKKLKYIGFYDTTTHDNEKRNTFLAATNKMEYIASAAAKIGYSVNIISPSWSSNKRGFYKGRKEPISKDVQLIVGPTFGTKNSIMRKLRILWSWTWLFIYLCFNTKKDDNVLVYHSIMLIVPVLLAKKIKKFRMILEVEEIYQDVSTFSNKMSLKEYEMFNAADKYIFPTELLNKKINTLNKPYAIIHGTYEVERTRNNEFKDNKIHVVYAGTFDPRKGGAAAAAAAEYLSNRYHVHIIGFGSKDQIGFIQEKIIAISKKTEATITYNGLLKGEEYIQFLQKCDIGLSTQIPGAAYNETSFPSKILSYMANGLRVVTVRIKAIEKSAIGDAVYYYEEQTPKSIADAIMKIDIKDNYDSRKLIKKLDEEFIKNINMLLEG